MRSMKSFSFLSDLLITVHLTKRVRDYMIEISDDFSDIFYYLLTKNTDSLN